MLYISTHSLNIYSIRFGLSLFLYTYCFSGLTSEDVLIWKDSDGRGWKSKSPNIIYLQNNRSLTEESNNDILYSDSQQCFKEEKTEADAVVSSIEITKWWFLGSVCRSFIFRRQKGGKTIFFGHLTSILFG